MADNQVNIKNKRATFEFEILDKYVAGMELMGTEIKSIRNGKAGLNEAYCTFVGDELFVLGMHIGHYENEGHFNHEEKRQRKLLLERKELDKLHKKVKEKGLTIIPLKIFLSNNRWAKLEIALAQGKKIYDKREDLKKKDAKREIDRMNKR
ncbi:MAG: SsrA-binding protein SmpB [Flavobacteriales bacterium]